MDPARSGVGRLRMPLASAEDHPPALALPAPGTVSVDLTIEEGVGNSRVRKKEGARV